jgi:Tol biopolymer transport system component
MMVACTLVVGEASATLPGRDGRISMSVFSNTGENIATVEPDGSRPRLLTHNSRAFFATWSPNGRLLAFDIFPKSGGGQIWLMRADGSHKQRVVGGSPSVLDQSPTWSPDARWIVFVHAGPTGGGQLWEVHPDGSSAHRLVALANQDLDNPAFSPNGRWIAFSDFVAGTVRLDIAGANGSHIRSVPNTRRVQGFAPNWSPSGRWIAFANHAFTGLSSVLVIHPDGTGLHQVTRPGVHHYNDLNPVWSPEGDQLAFQRSPCPDATNGCPLSQVAIWVIGADGSRPHAITHNPNLNYLNADWGRRPPN